MFLFTHGGSTRDFLLKMLPFGAYSQCRCELPLILWTPRHTPGFKLHGTDVAQCLMQTLPTVEDLNEFKDRGLSFVPSLAGLIMDEFVFQSAEEALDQFFERFLLWKLLKPEC